MRKNDEINDPNSCWNRALPNEMLFILLGRDLVAPDTIHDWRHRRMDRSLNTIKDEQIGEALTCAETMKQERDAIRRILHPSVFAQGLNHVMHHFTDGRVPTEPGFYYMRTSPIGNWFVTWWPRGLALNVKAEVGHQFYGPLPEPPGIGVGTGVSGSSASSS